VKKHKFLIVIILFFCINTFGSDRTLYVDNFSNILGNPGKEDKLLLFAKRNNFKTLILYQLNKVDKRWSLTDASKNTILADFISKAKTKYSIQNVGASGESATFFTDRIDPYNNTRKNSDEKFDVYNLEYEYWSKNASGDDGYYCENYLRDNNLSCTRAGSFQYFVNNLKELNALSSKSEHNIKIEVYLAYFSKEEMKVINELCYRVIIHAFGKNPKTAINSATKSLKLIMNLNSSIKTSILLSTRMNHMGYWFKHNSLGKSESLLFKEMNGKSLNLRKQLNLDGFSYQTYSYLEKAMNYYSYSQN
jgi:hypothetical protein